tara:strand:+ start:900 stop:1250 length:351 start_codon:yes stop_codon:yes gene_type:complete
MNKFCINILSFLISLVCFSFPVSSAEVLQITSSTILQVGDNNRTYTVKLACADINQNSEELAFDWIRKQLPRHTKVNLKPKGIEDGILLARVIPFNSDLDISELYINKGFAKEKCD